MYQYHNDMTLQRERLEAIEGIKDAVIAACNSTPTTRQEAQSRSRSCNPNWSRKWDTIMDSETRDRTRQSFDKLVTACPQVLSYTPEQFAQESQSLQTSGFQFGYGTQPWGTAQWKLFGEGLIEICQCRQSSTQAAPLPITPP
jgi:hypothetical protein